MYLTKEMLLSAAVFASAGFALFVALYNRFLLSIRNRHLKLALVTSLLSSLTAVPAAVGTATGFSRMWVFPCALLAAAGAGELRRIRIRRKCRADRPVESRNTHVSVFKPVTTTDIALRRYEITLSSLPPSLPRLRVVHLSDIHVHHRIPRTYYDHVVSEAVSWNPDLIVITGDFVTSPRYAAEMADILTNLRSRLGCFAVLGNHDHWAGTDKVIRALASADVRVLGNGWQTVRVSQECGLTLAGCEDPWGTERWTTQSFQAGMPVMALSHTADNVYKLKDAGAEVVFSGHYHGGQVAIPWVGTLVVPSRYGRRFDHGHFNISGTHLFVSSGVGSAEPPFRIYCKPEIVVVDCLPAKQRTRSRPDAPGPVRSSAESTDTVLSSC